MRRLVVMLAVVAAAILLAGGAALAVTISGTSNRDVIDGTDQDDNLHGAGGPDRISGLGGNDEVVGGDGDDDLFGTDSAQTAMFGNDEIYGKGGADEMRGGAGADWLDGRGGDDTIDDGPRDDAAVDTVSGGDGEDDIVTVNVPAAKDLIDCGDGKDRVQMDTLDESQANCEEVNILTGSAETLPDDPEFYRLAEESLQQDVPSEGEVAAATECTRSQWTGKPYKYNGRVWAKTKGHNGAGCGLAYNYGTLKNISGFYKPTLDSWGMHLRSNNGYITWMSGRCQSGREEYANYHHGFWYARSYSWITC